jgi:hypothetical protein
LLGATAVELIVNLEGRMARKNGIGCAVSHGPDRRAPPVPTGAVAFVRIIKASRGYFLAGLAAV